MNKKLKILDSEIYDAIEAEKLRQERSIELIASENFVSRAVLEAQGSIMTNKYAEGYAGKRYYCGCEEVDKAERLAIERLKQLFKCSYANVQPHSGSQAKNSVISQMRQFSRILEYSNFILSKNVKKNLYFFFKEKYVFSIRIIIIIILKVLIIF